MRWRWLRGPAVGVPEDADCGYPLSLSCDEARVERRTSHRVQRRVASQARVQLIESDLPQAGSDRYQAGNCGERDEHEDHLPGDIQQDADQAEREEQHGHTFLYKLTLWGTWPQKQSSTLSIIQ